MKKHGIIRRAKWLLEGAFAWSMYYLLKALPVDVASAALGTVARTIGVYLPVSNVARRNLDIAFPNKTREEKEHILRGALENLGRVVGEFPHLTALGTRVTVRGMEQVENIRSSGNSAIIFSGHLGNWEMFGAMAHREGLPISLVYRPANNPYTEALYRHARNNIAQNLYPKNREGAKQILKGIRGGELFGMLVDQKMNDGVAVPFFGHDAMTAKAIADFAIRQNVPIYPARIMRHEGVHFTLELFPAMEAGSDALELLTRINKLLEQWITETPEQWFWLHRRWPKEVY